METKYKLKDLRQTGFMEEHTFENKREILNFLLDDFLNFRMDEHKIEDLSLNYMLNNLELEIIEYEKEKEFNIYATLTIDLDLVISAETREQAKDKVNQYLKDTDFDTLLRKSQLIGWVISYIEENL